MRLFTVFGIRVEIHPSFWLLPGAMALWIGLEAGPLAGLRMFTLVLCIFLCVLGHEFTHSLRARSLGIQVPVITLYPMGGVACMEHIPREPWRELSIAFVGPLFNFVLAALSYFPLHSLLGADLFSPGLETWPRTVANLFWANIVLGVFNLIPAFPMDGGRMLRSFLALKLKYLWATRIAVFFGRIFAILFLILGVLQHRWMLVLVGVYVFFAASKEMRQAVGEHERA